MPEWIHQLMQLANPEYLIRVGGVLLLLIIVFIESGLFFGFFLPGDSLLFTAGLLCSLQKLDVAIFPLLLYIILACTLGSLIGFLFGYRMGAYLDVKKDTFFFKQKHMKLTRSFYAKHAHMTFIVGRFLPIIRTFVPILAGVIRMNFARFMFLNVLGCICWVGTVVLTGYFLGILIPDLIHYLEYIVIFLVLVTMIPVIRTYYKEKRELELLSTTDTDL
jgi:membrane-associated protein